MRKGISPCKKKKKWVLSETSGDRFRLGAPRGRHFVSLYAGADWSRRHLGPCGGFPSLGVRLMGPRAHGISVRDGLRTPWCATLSWWRGLSRPSPSGRFSVVIDPLLRPGDEGGELRAHLGEGYPDKKPKSKSKVYGTVPMDAWQHGLKIVLSQTVPLEYLGQLQRYLVPLPGYGGSARADLFSDPSRGNQMDSSFIKNNQDEVGERERKAADILMEDGSAEGVCANQVVRARPGPKCSKRRAVKEEERREKRAEEVRERRAISPGLSASTLEYLSENEILGPIEPVPVFHGLEETPHQQQGGATEDAKREASSEASSRSRDSRGRKAKNPMDAGRYAGIWRAREEARKARYARRMAEEELEERQARLEAARMGKVLQRVGPHKVGK